MTAMRIGPYVVERELGSGGMGTVYLARSRGGRAVAVKVARPELAVDPAFRARFRVEIEAARRVGGFHTAPVVDADPDGAPPWLATAYVPGPTLAARLATDGPMEEGTVRQLGAALAEALQAIHACGLVHRDLKPGNIVMAADGPRVLDFGIARAIEDTRLTATGHAFGTPGFLAPEQAVGADVTGAADIFALGAVLVVAAGGRPFGDGTPMALMYRSVHEEADLTPLPLALRPVAASCLSKNPADRPTPSALLDLLTTPGPQGVPPVHTSPPYLPPGNPSDAGRPLSHPSATHARRRDDTFGTRTTDSPRSFTAAADRSRVVVDEEGVLLQADTTEIEFPWEEIGAVTTTVTGLGRVLRVTVRTYEGESYSVDVRAPNRRLRRAWSLRMDRVLARHLDG